ncbi:glycosyltransferase [Alsobacter metallidurans]|uniref:glycosyltransferase n=1 Tax=Alsobacter metallidurans TaxID=340221 RepID=UPI001FCE4FFF|nr:glycosyltransferase [Alsobacter metallidurans]
MVFVEEPHYREGVEPFLERYTTPEGVVVAAPVLPWGLDSLQVTRAQRRLVSALVDELAAERLVSFYYTPMALPFTRHLAADVVVYDNMDELSAFLGAPRRTIALERELLRRADVVFTGGMSLYEAKKHRHANIHPFPSSIDKAHFGQARGHAGEEPADQKGIPGPRLGFFGVIDERMDVDLVGRMADLRPDWHFVMIGPVVKIDPASLPRRRNLHWLGGKSYAELPAYLAGWDVGLMPFAINEATRFISPTKTPEFLAAGKPVVSTPIVDVVRSYGRQNLVTVASTAEEFVARAEALMTAPRAEWLAAVDRCLAAHSWDRTWTEMDGLIRAHPPTALRSRTARSREAADAVRV